jgi:hypothetical protein
VIAKPNKFWLSPIVDQYIEDDVIFKGGCYPSKISVRDEQRVIEEAYKIVEFLSNDSYIGLGHIDFMISDGDVLFTEINPRKAGTTPCMSYMMENCFNFSIPIIEYHAVKNGEILNIKMISKNIPWSLHLVEYIDNPPNIPGDERDSFRFDDYSSILYNEFYKTHSFRIDINEKADILPDM